MCNTDHIRSYNVKSHCKVQEVNSTPLISLSLIWINAKCLSLLCYHMGEELFIMIVRNSEKMFDFLLTGFPCQQLDWTQYVGKELPSSYTLYSIKVEPAEERCIANCKRYL